MEPSPRHFKLTQVTENSRQFLLLRTDILQSLGARVKWFEHVSDGAVENDEVKLLWDMNIQCDVASR